MWLKTIQGEWLTALFLEEVPCNQIELKQFHELCKKHEMLNVRRPGQKDYWLVESGYVLSVISSFWENIVCLRCDCKRPGKVASQSKYVLKSSLMKLPVFGWIFHIAEFIPVERKWEADELKLQQMLSTFKDPQNPLWQICCLLLL